MRMARAGPATPPHKPTIGASATSVFAGARAVGVGTAASAGVGPIIQHQLTHMGGLPFANLIPPQGLPRFPLQSVSQPNSPFILSNLPALVDSSTPSIPVQSSQWPNILQPSTLHPNPASCPYTIFPLHSISPESPRTTTTRAITQEQIAQAGAPGVASNAGRLASDVSGFQVAM